MWKDEIIQDCLNTISRLNDELSERIKFEHKLMDRIAQLTNEINSIEEAVEQEKEERAKVEELTSDCLSKNGII